jgi:hypothetical protein
MIDRRALWISIALIVAMVAGTVWRLSLLPDWHIMPIDGPNGTHRINSLMIFSQPFALTLATVSLYGRKWLLSGSEEAEAPWRRWGTRFLVVFGVLVGLMQAFLLAGSLGYLTMDGKIFAQATMAATGILMMAAGNTFPKLPWMSMRLRAFRLDPWQQNRHLRFVGKMMVAFGAYFVLLAFALPLFKLLPHRMGFAVIMVPCLGLVAANFWHIAKLKREPAPPPGQGL